MKTKTQTSNAPRLLTRNRTSGLLCSTIAVAGVSWLSLSTGQAQTVISVNFQGGNTVGLASTDSTGVQLAAGWNNVTGPSGSAVALTDSTGAASGVMLTSYAGYSGYTGDNVATTGNGTPQAILFGGSLDSSQWFGAASFAIEGLSGFSSYDLVIYYSGIQGWAAGRKGNFSVSGSDTKYYFETTGSSADFTDFELSASTDPEVFARGNHVRFSGLTGETATALMENLSDYVVMAGFQIIGTAGTGQPDPFETWIEANYPDLPDKTAGGNPDGDSLTNLQEYAFGTHPGDSSSVPITYVPGGDVTSPGLPAALNLATGEGVDFRAVFGRRKDHQAAGLNYTVQFSAGLDVWVDSDVTPTVLTGENSGGIEAVSVPYPLFIPVESGFKKPTFFRVGVSSN